MYFFFSEKIQYFIFVFFFFQKVSIFWKKKKFFLNFDFLCSALRTQGQNFYPFFRYLKLSLLNITVLKKNLYNAISEKNV